MRGGKHQPTDDWQRAPLLLFTRPLPGASRVDEFGGRLWEGRSLVAAPPPPPHTPLSVPTPVDGDPPAAGADRSAWRLATRDGLLGWIRADSRHELFVQRCRDLGGGSRGAPPAPSPRRPSRTRNGTAKGHPATMLRCPHRTVRADDDVVGHAAWGRCQTVCPWAPIRPPPRPPPPSRPLLDPASSASHHSHHDGEWWLVSDWWCRFHLVGRATRDAG